MKAGKYFKGVIAVAVAVSMTSTPALQAAQTVARTGPGAAAAPAISAPLPGGLAAPEPGLAPALGALDGGLIAPASNAAPLSAAEAPPLPGADAALEPGVSYFQAPLNPALPSVGATARGELSSPAAIAQAVQKEGPPVNVWLALKDGGSSGALSFVVDPRIVPMLKDLGPDEAAAFLGKLFHEAPFAHGEDLRPLSKSKEPVTIALLDRSQSLFESHPEQRMIGVNRALFEAVKDPAVRGNLLLTGLSHELHQLADPAVSEQTLTELDARLFVHLSKSPWESAADWAAQALGGALAPNTPFQTALESALGRLREPGDEASRLRAEHLMTSGYGQRHPMEAAKAGFEALSKAAETSAPQGFWRAVEDAAKALAGAEAAGAYHGRVVPALAQAMPGRLDALAEAISETARAAVNMTEETVKNGLAPLAALLAARPSELPKAAALLAAAALSAPEASRRENAFGIYWRAQQALARNPADLDSFLYISALFGRNGMDPATPQIFMRKVSSGWSIPQSWKVFPRLAYADGAPVGLSAEDAAQARDVAAFVRWVSEVTDNRFAFPVRATPAGQAALAAELGALAVATEVGRDAGGLLLTINPANRTAKDILAELKAPRPADAPAADQAAPASWPAVSAQEKREAALALDAALDYLRREHVSEEQKIHRYQSYSPIAPLILAELFPKRASEYQAQVERELRALTPGRDIEWEAWRSSLRRLGDSLLASGARNKAKSIYAEAFQFDNGLDIALALAKGGEHAEALRYLDLMGGIIAAGLPFSANAGKVRADVTRIREFVDALPQGGPWTALYLERIDRLYRRLLNSALDEVDQGLERSVGEWSEPRLGIPSVESSGLTAFLEYIHLSPHRNRSQDWAVRASKDAVPGGSTHGGRLEAVWKLLSDVLAGRAGVSAWATAAVERLWSSPVKAALLGKLAEKASGAEREGLLERQRAAEEGYDAASPLRALERAGVPMPGEERTVWETEIFPEQNFATGLRLSGDDPRIGRLETMAKALAGGQRAEAAAGVALARELAQDLEDGEPDDGLHLLRFGALRAFIDALIAAGYFGEAESLFSGLSGRLLSRGRALIDLGERREAAGDRDAFHMESTGRRLIKMSSALDVLSRAKIARRLLESGDAAAANAAADAIAREYGRRPQDYNLAHVIQAAKWMGEAPGLERAASGLLLAAIRREGAQTAHYADALTLARAAIAAAPGMPRAALLDAALAALFERAKPVTSGENADLGDFERLFESYVELLKDVAHDPALSGARERLLGEIRRQLETHPFDPEDRHSAPIGWGRNMAELAEILGRGALGPLASPGP